MVKPSTLQIGDKFHNWTLLQKSGRDKQGRDIWLCRCDCGRSREIISSNIPVPSPVKCDCSICPNIHIGYTSGKLTVVSDDRIRIDGQVHFMCRCECCGKNKEISGYDLIIHESQSCGCLQAAERQLWIGKRFNNLTVIEAISCATRSGRSYKFNCKCDCGQFVLLRRQALLEGQKSCGCLKKKRNTNNEITNEKWSKKVLEKCEFKCQKCGFDKIFGIAAHHIHPVKLFPEYRFDINNGSCLCCNCHKLYHTLFPLNQINKESLQEFIDNPIEALYKKYIDRYRFLLRNKLGVKNMKKAFKENNEQIN